MRTLLIAALLLCAVEAHAGPLQDAYNAAQAALDAGRNAEAAKGFADLLAKMPNADKPGNRTAALIRSRLGAAYSRLNRPSDAKLVLERALAEFPATTDADRRERLSAMLDLGHALEQTQEKEQAITAYRTAIASAQAQGAEDLAIDARLGVARTSLFADPATARNEMDAILPVAERLLSSTPDQLASLYALRGRVELNQGSYAAAQVWLEKALRTAGGLDRRVSVFDTRIRSDLGILAWLQGNKNAALKYFAYTGAGHLPGDGLLSGADTPLPRCGEASGVLPLDTVIVDFAIAQDGRTIAPTVVYSSRPGAIETVFERSVAGWSWDVPALGKLPPFWRNSVRLQLRCANNRDDDAVLQSFDRQLVAWLRSRGVDSMDDSTADAVRLPLLRRAIEAESGSPTTDGPRLVPVLLKISRNSVAPERERREALERMVGILSQTGAPRDLQIAYRVSLLLRQADLARSSRQADQQRIAALEALIGTLPTGDESRGLAYARLLLAGSLERRSQAAMANQQYRAVADLPKPVVGDADPIRQVALLRIASIAAAQQRMDVAQAALEATGLSPDQCAIADVRPVKKAGSFTFSDFPDDALRWGFDGYAWIDYDVTPDGRTSNVRAVVAYPPFVFARATEEGVARFRFQPLYRDGGVVGCNGMRQRVNFKTPSG